MSNLADNILEILGKETKPSDKLLNAIGDGILSADMGYSFSGDEVYDDEDIYLFTYASTKGPDINISIKKSELDALDA